MAPDQGRSEDPVGQADGQRPRPDRRTEREAHRSDSGTLRLRPRSRGTGSARFPGGDGQGNVNDGDEALMMSNVEGPPPDGASLPENPPEPMPPPTPPNEPPPAPVIDPPPEPKPKGQ